MLNRYPNAISFVKHSINLIKNLIKKQFNFINNILELNDPSYLALSN